VKVLLDENLSPLLRKELAGHEVFTAVFLGWAGLKNGDLLKVAQEASFEVFVTGDQNLSYQQNLESRKIAIIVLSAPNWLLIKDHLTVIRAAVDAASPGSFQHVKCGEFRRM
jgi:hypothetical protein